MEWLNSLLHIVMNLDTQLAELVTSYGPWVYLILFLIIFAETGLVATPFLPGDSLLFAVGVTIAAGLLSQHWVLLLLAFAAILGDTVNYWIGHYVGPKVFKREKSWFFNPKYLFKAQRFYEKHGGKTIFLARFVPIIRTFAPFVAGVGTMKYSRFIQFNVLGGITWVAFFVYGGYFFGNLPFVKEHFSLVILAIIVISVIPVLFHLKSDE